MSLGEFLHMTNFFLHRRRLWCLWQIWGMGHGDDDVLSGGDGDVDGHDDVLGGSDGDIDGGDNGDDESADSNANCKLHWTLSSAVDRHAIAKS